LARDVPASSVINRRIASAITRVIDSLREAA
jgi:hypothetical protein